MSASEETEINALIDARMKALSITKTELVVRLGFRNVPKGLRRLDEVCDGDCSRGQMLLSRLPIALEVEPKVVQAALIATHDEKQREEEKSYRENFKPHAIIQTDRIRPEPLFVALLVGVEKILRIDFEDGSSPVSYAFQSLAAIQRRTAENGRLPAFGRPISYVVNYSPEKAVVFALDGTPQNVCDKAASYNDGSLKLRGRSLTGKLYLQDFIIL